MDLVRFPSEAHVDRTVKFLSGKYAEAPPNVLITLGRAAIPFMVKYRDVVAPGVPTILASVTSRDVARSSGLDNVVWVVTEYSFATTLELGRKLQPNAKNLVVVGGASEYDRQWLDDARRELQPYGDTYTIRYIAGLPYGDLLSEVSRLPKDTIVLMSFVFVDGSGEPRVPPEVAADVAEISPAPVYSPVSTFLGRGIVGGYTDSWEQQGAAAADRALEILSGKSVAAIPGKTVSRQTYQIDARQLKRWNLSQSKLPPGSDVQFREFDLWEQYRWQLIAIVAIVFAQAAMIFWLHNERRRRQIAQGDLRQRLQEVIHLNRTAIAGAMSASIAHELNQPLGAIRSYAEAAEIYLKATPPNVDRVEQILGHIRRDDQRAADIISHLRGLLKKRDEAELQEFDLGEAVRDAVQVVQPEALKRGVEIDASHANGSFFVRGDRVHLQQVILNLVMNGLDAMQSCAAGSGRMSIQTAATEQSTVEVSVSDSGTGIRADKLNEIFDTFFTTKRQGTGLGLSIARTIVETYGGKIWAENRLAGGAVFRFTLPLSKVAAA